ncbi:MAG TPA: cytochrome P450 [Roseiflexaceae bacterium]|nr:cytochrome P450 [Roseiflexaceae bacterium]
MARETSMKNNVGPSGHEASEGCPHRAALPAHPLVATALAGGPVIFEPRMNMWLITRYQDVVEAMKDNEHFSIVGALDSSMLLDPEVLEMLRPVMPVCGTSLMSIDPPQHTRMRTLINQAFTPRRVAQLEPLIRQVVNQMVDEVLAQGQADLVPLSQQLPMHVICTFLGIPEADREQVKRWSFEWLKLLSNAMPIEEQRHCANSMLNHMAYIDGLIARLRQDPQDDFISHLVTTSTDGRMAMSAKEIADTVNLLTVAGQESTAIMLSTCFYRLLSEPERWQAIREDRTLIEPFVEEVLRLDGVSMGGVRIVKEDVTLHGVTIPRGATVLLMVSAANMEPTLFAEPERFDPAREHLSRHVAFGYGTHFCLGAPLARLELRLMVDVLADRLPSLRMLPDQEIAYLPMLFARGLSRLLVAWDERA